MEPAAKRGVVERLDQLNEFERAPVTPDRLHGGGYFAGSFSGEHVAATEFVIGALFVNFGAGVRDVFLGLLLGNLLAVLSWTLLCAPIAVQTRLTLYWYLRKIGGPAVMVVYNVLNAVLYCILAGAMITVSASAVRLPFGIPAQTHWYPTDARFVVVVVVVGIVVVTLAIGGFKRLAQFASICSPWMLLMFVVGAVVMLPKLGPAGGWDNLAAIAGNQIWTGKTASGAEGLSFWHIVAFAWICNLGMHIGLSDMALFRFARHGWYGVYSAFGMYLGHYLAWICAGVMGAGAAVVMQRPLAELDSGDVAYTALGAAGALAVVVAGWTTANPTLYRAGLALQVVTPGWPRWLVTLMAGSLTTAIACSPFVFTRLLDFVGYYGLFLMPVGAIVVVEHWIFPRIGCQQFWSTRRGQWLNAPALAAWILALAAGMGAWWMGWIHLFFLALPVWFLTAGLYILLAILAGARRPVPVPAEPAAPSAAPPAPVPSAAPPSRFGRTVMGGLAVVCLVAIALFAGAVFANILPDAPFRQAILLATVGYFLACIGWVSLRPSRSA